MNVIVKISCFYSAVVTLKLRKGCLNSVTYNTPVLLEIKTEKFDVQNAILRQHIRKLQTFWPTLRYQDHVKRFLQSVINDAINEWRLRACVRAETSSNFCKKVNSVVCR